MNYDGVKIIPVHLIVRQTLRIGDIFTYASVNFQI